MYGLVNRAIEQLVTRDFGEERWAAVRARAGCPAEPFAALRSYDDQLTYKLVDAASGELGLPAEALLEAFGVYWTVHVAQASFGDMLRMYGDSVPEFVANLDAMHVQVSASMPELRPPRFSVREGEDGVLEVEYRSDRAGLAPMVKGLLQGVAQIFGASYSVELLRPRAADTEPDVFLMRPLPPSP